MPESRWNEVLNRLLVIHHRSLATYLRDARPWTRYGQENRATEVLQSIATEQTRIVDEIGELLTARNYSVYNGEFPLTFTALNDLSFSYLVKRLIVAQKNTIAEIEDCREELAKDPEGSVLVERALGAAKAHLEMLESCQNPNSAPTVGSVA